MFTAGQASGFRPGPGAATARSFPLLSSHGVSFATVYLAILPELDTWGASSFQWLSVYFYEHCCPEPSTADLPGYGRQGFCARIPGGELPGPRVSGLFDYLRQRPVVFPGCCTNGRFWCLKLHRRIARLLGFYHQNGHTWERIAVFPKFLAVPSTFSVLPLT